MKNENFSDLSTEDLLKRQKTIKPLTIILIGTLVILLVFGVTTFEWTEKLSPHALPLENEKQKKELQFRI